MNDEIHILILDDDPEDVEIIKWELEKSNLQFRYSLALNKHDFQEVLTEQNPDIILCDYYMPAFSYVEALNLVQNSGLSIPFIIISGNISEEVAVEIMKLGADDYIIKDRLQRLPVAISKAIDKYKAEKDFKTEKQKFQRDQAFLAAIVNNSQDAIYSIELDGTIVYWNKGAETIFGYTAEEITGKNISTFIPSEYQFNDRENDNKIKQGELVKHYETVRLKKDRSEINISLTVSPVKNNAGQIIGISKIARDITKQKKSEQRIVHLEKKFRALIENSTEGLSVVSKEGILLEISPSGKRILGYNENEIVGNIRPDLVHPDDLESVRKAFHESIKHPRKINTIEYRHVLPDGSYKWLEMSYNNLLDEPYLNAIVLNYRDVTERKLAAIELKESEMRLANAQAVAKVGSWQTDLLTLEVIWSDETYRIFEVVKNEFQNTHPSFMNFVHPDERKKVEKAFYDSFHSNTLNSITHRIILKDGIIKYVEENWQVTHDEKGVPVLAVGTCQDITEKKKAAKTEYELHSRLKAIFDKTNDAIMLADDKGNYVQVNPAAAKMLGYSQQEITSMNTADIISGRQTDELWNEFMQDGSQTGAIELVRKDGSLVICHYNATSNILPGLHLSILTDITERKKAEIEIINEKNLSETIINSLPGIFYLANEKGNYLRWNKNFEEVTGYNAEEIKLMHPLDFFEKNDKKQIAQSINHLLIHGETTVMADIYTKTKNKIPYYIRGRYIEFEGQRCFLGVGFDFSERLEAIEKIKKTTEQLQELTAHLQSVREEERKHIAREIHDELGQQLTAMKMDVVWIDKNTTDKATLVKSKLQNIITLLDDSNKSVRKILQELRPIILEGQSLIDALEWQAENFMKRTGIAIKFNFNDVNENLPEAISDCIYRVYQESLTNIIRYAEASEVTTSLKIKENELHFTIEDNGKGFNPEEIEHKKSFGLLGMKERIRSVNGILKVVSSKDNGTKIIAVIPYKT